MQPTEGAAKKRGLLIAAAVVVVAVLAACFVAMRACSASSNEIAVPVVKAESTSVPYDGEKHKVPAVEVEGDSVSVYYSTAEVLSYENYQELGSIDCPAVKKPGTVTVFYLAVPEGADSQVSCLSGSFDFTVEDPVYTSYTVKYLAKGSKDKVKKSKVVKKRLVGSSITVKAPRISNYTLVSKSKAEIKSLKKNPSENVVCFYYKKKAASNSAPSAGGSYSDDYSSGSYSNGSTNSGGSSSGGSGSSHKSSSDGVIWI